MLYPTAVVASVMNRNANVVEIRPDRVISVTDQLAVELGFELWLSSVFRMSPESALATALQILAEKKATPLFLVSNRTPGRRILRFLRRHPEADSI